MEGPVSIRDHFGGLDDPRVDRTKRHELLDIVAIAVIAVICGAEGWAEIALYGQTHAAWLGTFLPLPHGIPSRDTFRRVLSRIDPEQFARCFQSWVGALCQATDGRLLAIDGKTLRRSFDQASGKKALHLVSLWATENRLVLGQRAVDEKSNEITAIPKLLELIDLSGSLVTIDAMGCQKEIAAGIRREQADYVLAVKGNQPGLYGEVRECFNRCLETDFQGVGHDLYETRERGHGRTEYRAYHVIDVPAEFRNRSEWKDLRSLALVISQRIEGEQESWESRYYISSLPRNAKQLAAAIRSHWGIENSLHWSLDVCFREDESRVRKGYGPQNLACLRRLALSLLKQERSTKLSLRQKRLKATWDNQYVMNVLAAEKI